MKTMKKVLIYLSLALAALCSVSCLNDEPLIDWDDIKYVIELPYNSHYQLKQNVNKGDQLEFELWVNYTIDYASKVEEDIPVTMGIDEALVEKYNSTSTTKYELLPEGCYTLPQTLTIKKGTQLVKDKVLVNTESLKEGGRYILPVVIANVPEGYTISGNFGHLYLRVNMN